MGCGSRPICPPDLALWLLRLIETGVFKDPSEAVFVMLGEQQDLEAYPGLRRELLRRTLEAAENDPRPPIPLTTAMAEMEALLAAPRPPAAVWDAAVVGVSGRFVQNCTLSRPL